MEIEFTHYWACGFGWEDTILLPEDFIEVEKIGGNKMGENIYVAIDEIGGKHILKGYEK